jgi:hypothetical protein
MDLAKDNHFCAACVLASFLNFYGAQIQDKWVDEEMVA